MAQYDDALIARLERVWGRGFLSPGGAEEVHNVVAGLDLAGKPVLDIGCGVGGPAITMARDLGARVTGIDIEDGVLAHAATLVGEAGLGREVTLRKVAPGPLPFEDASFDVVFSKDSLIHIPDKPAIYAETARVLRPGGWLAVSDWLTRGAPGETPALDAWLAASHLGLARSAAADLSALLGRLGFEQIGTTDRTDWFVAMCHAEEAALDGGGLGADLIAILGADKAEEAIALRRQMRFAAEEGSLRPTHIRARKPERTA